MLTSNNAGQSASWIALQPIIKANYKAVWDFFKEGDEMSDELYDALFNHYCETGEMPYGVAKARSGDPMEWVAEKFQSEFDAAEKIQSN